MTNGASLRDVLHAITAGALQEKNWSANGLYTQPSHDETLAQGVQVLGTHSALDNVALLKYLLDDVVILARAELALESALGCRVKDALVAVSVVEWLSAKVSKESCRCQYLCFNLERALHPKDRYPGNAGLF